MHKVVGVWAAYISAWIVQLAVPEILNTIILVKEIFALIGFVAALGYTLYKFKKEWTGWLPKKENKNP